AGARSLGARREGWGWERPRGDRGRGGGVSLGMPRRRERRGVPRAGRGVDRLAARRGSGEQGAVCAGDLRGAQRHATRVAVDRLRVAARPGGQVDGRWDDPLGYPALRCDGACGAAAPARAVRVRDTGRPGARRGGREAGVREGAKRILLEADFGVAATAEILEQVARVPDGDLQPALEQAVARILSAAAPSQSDPGRLARAPEPPSVMLVFGVNGVGKTTTIAKLAHRLER